MGGFHRSLSRVVVGVVLAAFVVLAACVPADVESDAGTAEGESSDSAAADVDDPDDGPVEVDEDEPRTTSTDKPDPTEASGPLLSVTDRKDGDSWVATDGNEYRLGLVDAPELSQPCGSEASAFTYEFLADGFRADAYTTDQYGRLVAEVFDPSGESLNVALAASGLGGDRYLEQFRHENSELADRLDAAFASAPESGCGTPTTVAPQPIAPTVPPSSTPPATTIPPATAPPASGCHPAYTPCVPTKGDGSGNGDANDLDCGDIGHPVQRTGSADPYRLDADGDGTGCES